MDQTEDKKGIGALLASAAKCEVDPAEQDGEVGFEALATDMMAAMKTDDATAFKSALRGFIEMMGPAKADSIPDLED